MKTTILLLVLIVGHITPTYSQLNQRSNGSEQFQNKKNADFGTYKFDKFSGASSYQAPDSFTMLPRVRPTQRINGKKIYTENKTPCIHPKSGDEMPCFKQNDVSSMTIFKPKNVIWGILW